jgi:hypothetical protein
VLCRWVFKKTGGPSTFKGLFSTDLGFYFRVSKMKPSLSVGPSLVKKNFVVAGKFKNYVKPQL